MRTGDSLSIEEPANFSGVLTLTEDALRLGLHVAGRVQLSTFAPTGARQPNRVESPCGTYAFVVPLLRRAVVLPPI